MEVNCALPLLLFTLLLKIGFVTAQSPDYPVTAIREFPNYLRSESPFKPSPLLETYFESEGKCVSTRF